MRRLTVLATICLVMMVMTSCGPKSALGSLRDTSVPPPSGVAASMSAPGGSEVGAPRPTAIRIGSTLSCPAQLGNTDGVNNADAAADGSLMPSGSPQAGLLCAYTQPPNRDRRQRPVHLSASAAAALATALAGVRLGVPDGEAVCPADFETNDLLVFSYPAGRVFAVWYSNSGCRSLSNGRDVAGQGGRSTFAHFQTVLAQLAPSLER